MSHLYFCKSSGFGIPTLRNPLLSKHVTRNGTHQQFSIDPESRARLLYCQASIEHFCGTEINQSAVVRLALRYMTFHLEGMLQASPIGTPLVTALKYNLRTSSDGSRSFPSASLAELKALASLPSFAELMARLQPPKQTFKQLLGRPMYESRTRHLKRPSSVTSSLTLPHKEIN